MSKLGLMIDCVQSIQTKVPKLFFNLSDLIFDLDKLESNAKCKIVDGFKMSFSTARLLAQFPNTITGADIKNNFKPINKENFAGKHGLFLMFLDMNRCGGLT